MNRSTSTRWCLVTAVVITLGACSSGGEDRPVAFASNSPGVKATTSTTSTSTTTTTTTTLASIPTPTAVAAASGEVAAEAPAPAGLRQGSEGEAVRALEQRLDALRYDPGSVDGVFSADTGHAVMAFQKVMGMERTGEADDATIAAVNQATTTPPPIVPGGGFTRVEIDLPRQVLFLYENDTLARILPISSGNEKRFCSQGYCRNAVTPGGSFSVYRKARGWETSPLGRLYNSQYFNGGIAIHGSTSVPGYPASHGCIRIPMSAAEWFPDHVPMGTPVYVLASEGDSLAPVTADPGGDPAAEPAPTTTVPSPPVTLYPPTTTTPPLSLFGTPTTTP